MFALITTGTQAGYARKQHSVVSKDTQYMRELRV